MNKLFVLVIIMATSYAQGLATEKPQEASASKPPRTEEVTLQEFVERAQPDNKEFIIKLLGMLIKTGHIRPEAVQIRSSL